jgi:hypothetical protein
MITRKVEDFWQSVEQGNEPAPDLDSDLRAMCAAWLGVDESRELDWAEHDRAEDWFTRYAEALAAANAADAEKDRIRAEMLVAMGDAIRARHPAGQVTAKVVTRGERSRREIRVSPRKG